MIGRLTRDAELKYTVNGQAVCKFAIAVNRQKKEGDNWVGDANFFDIILWGKSGETINQYLLKGKQIAVSGELRQERWEKDGQSRSRVEIVANTIQLLGGGQGSTQTAADHHNHQDSSPRPTASASARASDDGFTDDIPF